MPSPIAQRFSARLRMPCRVLLAAIVSQCCGLAPARSADALWTAHVEPLLKEHCADCHNAVKAKSGLDLSSFQSILRGGSRGPAVIPGRPEESNLYKFLAGDSDPHMPPGNRPPLGAEEAGLIKKWIQDLPIVPGGQVVSTGTNGAVAASGISPARPRIAWKPRAGMPTEQVVDHFLELAWKRDKVRPARPTGDGAFARRVYLDLAGRIPTVEEAASFVKDQTRDKRARLIDVLLASSDYPRHLREVFDPVLMERRGPEWEEQRASQQWFAFLEDAFRRNRPWNEVVRDLIVARPGRPEERGAVWYLYERHNNPQAVAEALAPVVFGVQVKCAQCHDHMVAREIKQAHYWGMVAALNRSKNLDTPAGPAVTESAVGGFVTFANLKKESQPALLTFFNGRGVDEARPKEGEKEADSPALYLVPPPAEKEKPVKAAVPKFSRRQAFADAVTQDNPLLARAMVNRVWAMLFGRGLVHPVDLMDSKHPPSHPELLDWLAQDFARGGYDVKVLIRSLCRTKAYQLDSRSAAAGKSKVPPTDAFARALDKPLSGEQLFQSVLVATGSQPDADGKIVGHPEKELRRAFVARFPDLFPAEYNATLFQAMFLANSPLFDQLLAPRAGNLAFALAALPGNKERVRQAFQAVLDREPERDELRECTGFLAARSPEAGVKQLLWALLTSAEFQLNH